ncbi:MAG: glycosyl hydrolase [Acidobacteria bacterium]|nr:glycosyl hydrolase [Acidobacteriota bacterium]
MRKVTLSFSIVFSLIIGLLISANAQIGISPAAKPNPLKNLQFRLVGPFRGGRAGAVEGVASQPGVYYYGATGGGVWKSTDNGVNWINISDGWFKTTTIGAIDAADSDPNIVYVGTGEETVRGNVQSGDGVYKSTDGGKTWKNIGLGDTQQISRVRVNPKDPNIVFVAALGHLWGSNSERGIFRTKDGGKTWEKVLFRNNETGASDLIMDPSNPNTLYAAFWQIGRKPWRMDSGGDGSGLFKSIDGGDTWVEITRNRGLPAGVDGKINVTVSPVNTSRLWAMVENKDGGLFRSDDGGDSWTRVNESAPIRQRPWYFNRVYADTQSLDTVYVMNVQMSRSIDGGRTFTTIGGSHGDHHDLWINPTDNKRLINGNDGGATVSSDAGATWTEEDEPTAQFYRVATDNDFPYHIYGAQQDNSTVRIASRSDGGTIGTSDWYDVGGGESGWIVPHPDNSEIVFAGSYDGLLTRTDHRSGNQRDVNPYPDNPMGSGAEGAKYRFQWNFPLLFSPHKTNGKWGLYAAANVLFRSYDEGGSWQAISPDLTRNDKSKQKTSGGPISQDNTSIEYYDTIFAVDESPLKQGVIWAGTDDGLVQLSQDDGKTWTNVTPKDMPEWIQINQLKASPFDPATAYVAAVNYKNDDLKPYMYKTTDYGKTWKKIVNGIPSNEFTRVVIEDPNRRDFLYAGTERGIYYSSNGGDSWQSLQLNLPVVQVADLTVQKRDKDLVVATHGRSFYVLDNLPVLYDLAKAQASDAFLFKPEDAYRTQSGGGFPLGPTATVGANPPNGAVVNYWLKDKVAKEVTLEFVDGSGAVVRKFTKRAEGPGGAADAPAGGFGADPAVPANAGLNTFVWNLRKPNATTLPGVILWAGSLAGPRVPPGNYQVRLSVDGKPVGSESFALLADPRLTTSQEDFAKQYDLMNKINAKINETHGAIADIRDIRTQLETLSRKLKPEQKPLIDMARSINAKLTDVEEALIQTKIRSGQDALNFPIRLNNKLAALSASVDSSDDAPTAQAYAVFADLTSQVDAQLAKLAAIKSTDIAAFNKQYAAAGLPVIISNK